MLRLREESREPFALRLEIERKRRVAAAGLPVSIPDHALRRCCRNCSTWDSRCEDEHPYEFGGSISCGPAEGHLAKPFWIYDFGLKPERGAQALKPWPAPKPSARPRSAPGSRRR